VIQRGVLKEEGWGRSGELRVDSVWKGNYDEILQTSEYSSKILGRKAKDGIRVEANVY